MQNDMNIDTEMNAMDTDNNATETNATTDTNMLIQRLTKNIDMICSTLQYSPMSIHALLWDDINTLRYMDHDEKEKILNDWKYGLDFKCTENSHLDGCISFGKDLSWEQSYVLGLIMYISY
jgi:hypothetical protein